MGYVRYLILEARAWGGKVFNRLGCPGFVRDCDYEAVNFKGTVRVRRGRLFTVISVNGLNIYFRRLTGRIDGVGFVPLPDYASAEAQEPEALFPQTVAEP